MTAFTVRFAPPPPPYRLWRAIQWPEVRIEQQGSISGDRWVVLQSIPAAKANTPDVPTADAD